MKKTLAAFTLCVLGAACGTVYVPRAEPAGPLTNGASAPAVSPSSSAVPGFDAKPLLEEPASSPVPQSRPMGEQEVTPAPALNAPAPAMVQPGDRCNTSAGDSKVPPPACAPQ